ncbi:hypothetical protein D9758_010602 [Tetrapyrgos nigripes]|uniref:O-methyltransferase n=1 Tax=Tetrapyrgos nigripes TaxID=182062 RepID=A0A8H5D5Y1_9AGAR|nr:hypothetical protein D9758_010602 [Tetrapyrgos nigripes]
MTTIEDRARESDNYNNSFLVPADPVLDAALKNASDKGLPVDDGVSKAQGKFLYLLAKTLNAKRILEVGTLGGYSTIWLGRALPEDGELYTLEVSKEHAKVAEENLSVAGLSAKCKVIVGPAYNSMLDMKPEVPYDLIFIDADKPSNTKYFTEAKRLVRAGGVIIVDNVIQFPDHVEEILQALRNDKDLEAVTMGTIGEKGYDGFIYARKRSGS